MQSIDTDTGPRPGFIRIEVETMARETKVVYIPAEKTELLNGHTALWSMVAAIELNTDLGALRSARQL